MPTKKERKQTEGPFFAFEFKTVKHKINTELSLTNRLSGGQNLVWMLVFRLFLGSTNGQNGASFEMAN